MLCLSLLVWKRVVFIFNLLFTRLTNLLAICLLHFRGYFIVNSLIFNHFFFLFFGDISQCLSELGKIFCRDDLTCTFSWWNVSPTIYVWRWFINVCVKLALELLTKHTLYIAVLRHEQATLSLTFLFLGQLWDFWNWIFVWIPCLSLN